MKNLLTSLVVIAPGVSVVATVANDGDPSVTVNGKRLLPGRPTTPEGRRKWALEAALRFASTRPDLHLTEADLLAGAEKFLAWLEKRESNNGGTPPAPPEML